jgi:hypothetical protein
MGKVEGGLSHINLSVNALTASVEYVQKFMHRRDDHEQDGTVDNSEGTV